jgi:antitoxin (DNA-binding transcriptional repressor) of toxin-antitoxin stability system
MQASALDLRTHTRDLLGHVAAGETVIISHRGHPAAMLAPLAGKTSKSADLPAFGMWADRKDLEDPSAFVRELRRSRF